ncbi:MAG: hypothetical protein J7L62_01055 [Candidatus Aminicenantes bacterium]|nr:hypothetical protein [Candidatus Aminicenantes bacterium]
MKLANLIFSTNAKIDALRTIYFSGDGISGRKISLLGEINPRSCQLALQELEELGIILKNGNRKRHNYSLNREHPLYSDLLKPIFEGERKLYRQIGENIMNLLQDIPGGDSLISIWSYEKRQKGGKIMGMILVFGMEFERRKFKKVESISAKTIEEMLNTPVVVKAMLLEDLRDGTRLVKLTEGAILRVIFGEKPENIAKDLNIRRGPAYFVLSNSLSVS